MKKAFLGTIDNKKFEFPLEVLKKHFIALGSSGSGKTVLCKLIIEEAARNKIPAIIVDSQGDLASLAMIGKDLEKNGISKEMQEDYFKNSNITIFTPCSSKGIPICINPLKIPSEEIEKEELVGIVNQIANATTKLLGYKDDDKGNSARSILYLVLLDSYETKNEISSFSNLADIIGNLPEDLKNKASEFINSERDIKELVRKIKYLTIGENDLLFQFGVPLDISKLIKSEENKTQISIIYLNSLRSEKEKHFFISMLSTSLYQWMLANPSKNLQALYYLDEIAEYIPAGAKKPITKEILQLIFKQARKYGVGCIISTQNPGDIDYKAFAQFGTWAIGRLTVKQDRDKIKDAIKSLAGSKTEEIINDLPKLQPSEFIIFSPDTFKDIKKLKSRYLITQHKTLTENDIKDIIPQKSRDKFKIFEVKKTVKETIKKSKPHFKINISSYELNKIIESKQKKFFVLFGPKKEFTESVSLFLHPIFIIKIRQIKKGLIRKNIEENTVLFDSLTGDIIKSKNNSFIKIDSFSNIIGLSDNEIRIIKILTDSPTELTAVEIGSKLGFTDSFVKTSLNNMMKKKIVSCPGKSGKTHLWTSVIKINTPESIHKIASGDLIISEEHIDAEILEEKIDIKKISHAVESFFKNSEIIEHSTTYYPFYQVKLSSKNKTRVLKISAVDGKIID